MTQEELLLSILFHGDKYSDFHKQKILADLEQVYERQQTRKDAQED